MQSSVSGVKLFLSRTNGKIPTGTESVFQRAVSRRYVSALCAVPLQRRERPPARWGLEKLKWVERGDFNFSE